jgi:hypothetical protein
MQTRLFIGGELTEPKATWINIDAQLPAYYPR